MSSTLRASFYIAPRNVKLTFQNFANVTRALVGSPVFFFRSVWNTIKPFPPDHVFRLALSSLDSFRPPFGHFNAVINDPFVFHFNLNSSANRQVFLVFASMRQKVFVLHQPAECSNLAIVSCLACNVPPIMVP